MEQTVDVFITNLDKNVSKKVIENFFSNDGKVLRVKFIDDKKNPEKQLAFVGFRTVDEAIEAVRIADKSTVFGTKINAVISKKSIENIDSNPSTRVRQNYDSEPLKATSISGRGRGLRRSTSPCSSISIPSYSNLKLEELKLNIKQLTEVEIIDVSNLERILVRPVKQTEQSKSDICDILNEINSKYHELQNVNRPNIGECYLAKWDDECYYRAELLEILNDGNFKVTFIDEGTTNDIVSDIKRIPDGLLQKYPKQFVKVTLGVSNSKKLHKYIIDNSENKVPHIYWLGHFHEDVPIVNLFLGDEDIISNYEINEKVRLRNDINSNINDLPLLALKSYSDTKFLPKSFKSINDFQMSISMPNTVNLGQKNTPKILPMVEDFFIYENKTQIQLIPMRCIIRKSRGLSYDIELIDTGNLLTNIHIDSLFQTESDHFNSPPAVIHCQLENTNAYPDNNSLMNLLQSNHYSCEITGHISSNIYSVVIKQLKESAICIKYPEFDLKSLVGNSYQVSITHSVSPINFYVQINRPDCVMKLMNIHEKINCDYPGRPFKSLSQVQVGQAVIGRFSMDPNDLGDYFRANVIDKRPTTNELKLFYVDYGNEAWVNINQCLDVDDALAAEPCLAIKCTLNVSVNREAWAHAIDIFHKLIGFPEGDDLEMVMQVRKEASHKIIVDLTSTTRGLISEVLVNQGVCTADRSASNKSTPVKPCNGNNPDKDNQSSKSFFVNNNNSTNKGSFFKSSTPNTAISNNPVSVNLFKQISNDTKPINGTFFVNDADMESQEALLKKIEELEFRVSKLERKIRR